MIQVMRTTQLFGNSRNTIHHPLRLLPRFHRAAGYESDCGYKGYNWGEPEQAPYRQYSFLSYDLHPPAALGRTKCICRASNIAFAYMASVTARESPARCAWSHEVCRVSNIAWEVDWKSIYCPESLVLPDCFGVSLAFVVHSMNFAKVSPLH